MSKAVFEEAFDVSRETLERLEVYATLLRQWTKKINLVAPSTLDDLWSRHFVDSAQVLFCAPEAQRWADLGSGGGFPGAVIAVLAAELRPKMQVTMVESDQRKSAFLRSVLREVGVDGEVITNRIEEVEPLNAGIVSARALAPLPRLLGYAERHLAPGGRGLFMKGQKAGDEIALALETWRFDCETYVSKTDVEAVILSIGDIERV